MTFYDINDSDRVSKKSNIRQLVDILQTDIAALDAETPSNPLNTRKKYGVFKAGGLGETEVTSSLYQTVFDQDHTFQTSNEMLDITIGCHVTSATVTGALSPESPDSSGKLLFNAGSLMMREKIAIYSQYAQVLLGDSSAQFFAPFDADVGTPAVQDGAKIQDAVFINFKRLFIRDGMEKEQFSLKLHKLLPAAVGNDTNIDKLIPENTEDGNNDATFKLYSDANAKSNLNVSTVSGHVGNLVDDDGVKVGLIFYNKGILVLDARKVFNVSDVVTGAIDATDASNTNFSGFFIPNFWRSGSIDNIIDHICDTRFGRDNKSAIGFINETSINSTLYFCRVGPNDANFSTNPTYTDDDGNIRCIQNKGDDPFSYITTIGLYDASGELLAVAKTSRPIEKNPEVDLSISVRLDY